MQSFAWLWAICGVCSRFGKSWIGVRKGEKFCTLWRWHGRLCAAAVVRRRRRANLLGRFLVSHFTICNFLYMRCTKKCASECITRPLVQTFHIPRRSRFYGGSGVYRPPRREMAGIPGVSRLTSLTLPRFARVPGPCSYRFFLVFPVDLSRFARVLHPLLPRFSIFADARGFMWMHMEACGHLLALAGGRGFHRGAHRGRHRGDCHAGEQREGGEDARSAQLVAQGGTVHHQVVADEDARLIVAVALRRGRRR